MHHVDRITLDRDVFKALASDTRLDILKALDVRQKTVTELARELDLNKSTVLEHLEKLQTVGLIAKIEEDVERKWVYWQLTWTGRRLLHPEQIKVALLLSTAGGALASAIAAVWLWLRSRPADVPAQEDARVMIAPADPPSLDPVLLAAALVFAALALLAVAWAVRVHLKARAPSLSAPEP